MAYARTYTRAPVRHPQRRLSPKLYVVAAVIMVVGYVWLYIYCRSPWRVCKRFMHAVEARDVETIYALAHPKEKEPPVGLTRQQIRTVVELFHQLTKDVRLVKVEKFPHDTLISSDGKQQMEWLFDYVNPSTGAHLRPGVILEPTHEGWKAYFSFWAYQMCATYRTPPGLRRPTVWQMFRYTGLPGYVHHSGEFAQVFPQDRGG